MSGLFQALLGQTAELPQLRLDGRKQALNSVNMDTLGLYPQRLGEVFSFLNHWFKIAAVVDAELAADHAQRVSARREKRS